MNLTALVIWLAVVERLSYIFCTLAVFALMGLIAAVVARSMFTERDEERERAFARKGMRISIWILAVAGPLFLLTPTKSEVLQYIAATQVVEYNQTTDGSNLTAQDALKVVDGIVERIGDLVNED